MPEPTRPTPAAELPPGVAGPLAPIEAHLAAVLREPGLPQSLRRAMEYATLGGGKRLRPLLAWHSCAAAGGRGEQALPVCAAVELVHCFSLVHDDLPALDNDDLRRGRPTLHVHAGQAMAILAGDALLTMAFKVLTQAGLGSAAVGELALACERMIAGQVLDTLGFAGEPDAEELPPQSRLETIHHGKTGAMLVASVRLGAMSASAPDPAAIASLTAYGRAIGLMFQVVDDLLDVTQAPEHTGKRTGKDAPAGKLTYPGVLGVERSRELVRQLEADALAALSDLGPAADPLRDLCGYLAVRTR